MQHRISLFFIIGTLLIATSVIAQEVYQKPQAFLDEVFNGSVPKPKTVWLTGERRGTVEKILSHAPHALRVRYWQKAKRSAWILEEIGKEKMITTGIVINDGHIEQVKVLIFRESRGWEVRYPFFTDQFKQASLNKDYQLDRTIDGISGATLSVRAVRKLAALALYLHQQVNPA